MFVMNISKFKIKSPMGQQQGVVLLEALIAILIFSFGILALAGLQGAMVKNTTDSKFRSDAANVAQRQLGIIWANPTNIANYLGTTTVNDLPNGSMTVAQPVAGRITIRVLWQQPGQAQHNYDANAYVITGCPSCS
jgi:type IV pilus assembly protein PilV